MIHQLNQQEKHVILCPKIVGYDFHHFLISMFNIPQKSLREVCKNLPPFEKSLLKTCVRLVKDFQEPLSSKQTAMAKLAILDHVYPHMRGDVTELEKLKTMLSGTVREQLLFQLYPEVA